MNGNWAIFVIISIFILSISFSVENAFAQTPQFLFEFNTYGGVTPYGLVVDSLGNIYVSTFNGNSIQKFDSNGKFLLQFGSFGSGDDQFNVPHLITIDNNDRIIVADAFNDRIQVFDSSGTHLLTFGSFGSGDEQFNLPQGVAVDNSNNIYVADTDNNRIQKFDSSGNHLLTFGSCGPGDGQFCFPIGIIIDNFGDIYVGDRTNFRVVKFDSSGTFQLNIGSSGSGDGQLVNPHGLTVGSSGNILVADLGNHRIQKFDSAGNFLLQFGSFGSGDGQFSSPTSLTTDSSEKIYVADHSNRRVQVFETVQTEPEPQPEPELPPVDDSDVINEDTPFAICHMPAGNPENPQDIQVSENAFDAHIAHGDYIGNCVDNELGIQEFSSDEAITNNDTFTEAIEFLRTLRVNLSSDSNVESAVSQAAQLYKLFEHEDKTTKKAFKSVFNQFNKDVKAFYGKTQVLTEKALLNELDKAAIKLQIQINKNERDEQIKNKIKFAIQLANTKEELQNIRNQISIEKLKYKIDNKELESLIEIEFELLKQTLIFEAKSNNEKITPELIKSIEKKAEKKVEESHNDNSGKGNSDNGKGNSKGNDKGSDKKSKKSKGNSGKSKGKK